MVPFADGIGDFVMMLPLLGAVQRRYPEARVTVAASQRSALLLNDAQAAALTIRTPSWIEGEPGPRGGPLRRLVPQSVLASVAGAALRAEFGRFDRTLNLFWWWERGMDFGRYWTPQVPLRPSAVHTVDLLAERLGRELGAPLSQQERRPQLEPRAAAAEWAARWSAEQRLDGRTLVALIPASNMRIKRWAPERWAALVRTLAAHDMVPVVLLPPKVDPVEAALADLGGLRQPPVLLRTTLDRAAALLARCRLAVGVDTGLLHLAAGVGTRYVGLFGPTNPEVTGPYDRTRGTALVAPFPKQQGCAGCWRQFKYVDDTCRTVPGGSCMTALEVDAVLAACLGELRLAQRTAN